MEVLYIDIFVGRGFPLAPEEKTLFGSHLFNWNILDGEPQDDGPDHAQRHLHVAVDDFWKCEKKCFFVNNDSKYNMEKYNVKNDVKNVDKACNVNLDVFWKKETMN